MQKEVTEYEYNPDGTEKSRTVSLYDTANVIDRAWLDSDTHYRVPRYGEGKPGVTLGVHEVRFDVYRSELDDVIRAIRSATRREPVIRIS